MHSGPDLTFRRTSPYELHYEYVPLSYLHPYRVTLLHNGEPVCGRSLTPLDYLHLRIPYDAIIRAGDYGDVMPLISHLFPDYYAAHLAPPPPAPPMPKLLQTVTVTRVAEPPNRDFATTYTATVPAGTPGEVLQAVFTTHSSLPRGAYVITLDWPHEEELPSVDR